MNTCNQTSLGVGVNNTYGSKACLKLVPSSFLSALILRATTGKPTWHGFSFRQENPGGRSRTARSP